MTFINRGEAMIASWNPDLARRIIDQHGGAEGAMLPLLHALQETFGYVPDEAKAMIADALNLSRAEVHGVVSFYHDFRSAPPPALVVKLCRAEACQAAGAREAAQTLLTGLGLDWNEAASDGLIVVEPVYCLGLCAVAPAALIGDELAAGFDGPSLTTAVRATVAAAK